MGEGSGYNPYRKSNGEFASKDEIGDLNEKLSSDLVDASDAGDDRLIAQIEGYAMEKLPESPLGKSLLEARYGTSATATASKQPNHSKLGIRELQKLAKDTDDPELQLEIARRGNSAALRNLARNLSATTEALEAAYIAAGEDDVRKELAANPQSDLRIMHSTHVAHAISEAAQRATSEKTKELRQLYRDRADSIVRADWIDDATVAELQRSDSARVGSLVQRAMANPRNLISEDAAVDYANGSPVAGSIAIGSGRIEADRLSEIVPSSARFERSTSGEVLTETAKLSGDGRWDSPEADPWGKVDPHGRRSREITADILANEATPAEAVNSLVGNPRVDSLKLYGDPRLSTDSRARLEGTDPKVQSHLRIEAARGQRTVAELKDELRISGTETNTQRGYHRTDLALDRSKIAAYGLSREDVESIMGGDRNFYHYDPETGRYSGGYDSGD